MANFPTIHSIHHDAGDDASLQAEAKSKRSLKPTMQPVFVSLDSTSPLPMVDQKYKSNVAMNDVSTKQLSQQDTGESIRLTIETATGKIWVEGNSLFCACPQCSAPMSVRMWLLTADCWQCGTRIQLTREQEEAVERLLRDNERHRQFENETETPPNAPSTTPTREFGSPSVDPEPKPTSKVESPGPQRSSRKKRRRKSAGDATPLERIRKMRERRSTIARMRETFRMTPAWLISFLLHLILIIVLLMLYFDHLLESKVESITLSTAISVVDEEGGEITLAKPEQDLDFEAPVPRDADLADADVRETILKADQDAKELRVDENPQTQLPDLNDVKRSLTTNQGQSARFVARDPRLRVEMLKKEGGTSLTEAAVARGLRWLAKVQNSDGSWSVEDYKYHYRKNNRGDMAATALALLPFLGAGQTHEVGRYKSTVAKGLRWMIENQDSNSGDLRGRLKSNVGMYAHGQGAIVLVEAYALSGDEQFRLPAQRAIDFIVGSQHITSRRSNRGGWRYNPGSVGDTSVTGWQMMALQSALLPQLGLDVPRKTILYASDFLDSMGNRKSSRFPAGTRYRYIRGSDFSPAMTAEALLCRIYLGWKRDDIRLKIATEHLLENAPPSKKEDGEYNLYYIYYATQFFHHYGGDEWKKWNSQMQKTLVPLQRTTGNYAGSFDADRFAWGNQGGRIYSTSLAVCTLEVYYRHLPLFKQIDIDADDSVSVE